MGRKILLLIVVCLMLAVMSYPCVVSAKNDSKPNKPPKDNPGLALERNKCARQSGHSHNGHLFLYQEDPETGEIVQKGAWGRMTYRVVGSTFRFVFNGHRLMPGTEYTLLYFPEPFPGVGLICLGSGIANNGGNVHIMEMEEGVDTCDLPAENDDNYPDGALIILVPSADVDCENSMLEWNPMDYLFGCDFITFYDTDGCGELSTSTTIITGIDIEKSTNGEDADEPSGPIVVAGEPVEWTYVVTNTSDQPLVDVVVTDDQGVTVSCPTTALAPGESMTCTASGVAVVGQYGNIGTVVATAPDETVFTDSDPSHYYGAPFMIDWANLLSPMSIVDHTIGAFNPTEDIRGHVRVDGVTEPQAGPVMGILAQVGYGPDGSDPDGNLEWKWFDAIFSLDFFEEDRYVGQLLPEAVGSYDYAYRFSSTEGLTWLYADLDGTDNGYDPAAAGDLTVIPSDDTIAPDAPANLIVAEKLSDSIALTWDAVGDVDVYRYEVFRGDVTGGPYSKIADVLAPTTGYIDTAVMSGTTYYYVVVAVDTSFNPSGHSNEVEAVTPTLP